MDASRARRSNRPRNTLLPLMLAQFLAVTNLVVRAECAADLLRSRSSASVRHRRAVVSPAFASPASQRSHGAARLARGAASTWRFARGRCGGGRRELLG